MLFKYKIENTGEHFFYSNKDHSLYKEDMTPVMPNKKGTKKMENGGSFSKSNKPRHIRISMGKTCNFSCVYCLQDSLSDKKDIEIDETGMDKFLAGLDKLDLSELERVELWGGEPFIYWKVMQKILLSSLDHKDMLWYICTNGSMVKDYHLDFLDKIKGTVALGISHDGPEQKTVRGRCPLEKLTPVLQRMDKTPEHYGYGFQVTLSQGNCDVYSIQEFFKDYMESNGLLSGSVTYVPVESYDLVSYSQTIHGDSIQTLRGSIKKLLDKNMSDYMSGNKTDRMGAHDLFITGTSGIWNILRTIKEMDEWPLATRCGALWEQLISVDIQGNVLSCPHVGADTHGCGTIDKMEDVKIKKVLLHEDYGCIDCASCPVMVSCQYGCPLDLPDAYRIRGCEVMLAFFSELYLSTFKMIFESEITFVGAVKES